MSLLEQNLHLPEHLSSVTRARHFVRDVLVGWDLEALVEDAQLGTSELVANAVRHAGTDLVLTIRVDGVVTISIQDGHPELRRPVIADSDFLAENGRGLHIVAAIAHDWGITTAANGKVVWFNLSIPESGSDDADVLSMDGRRPGRPSVAGELPEEGVHGVEEHVEARRRENVESTG
ncbi:MAG TPA: ATP-binding protein [Acidimicrobiales bacterium]|nr:ATP-binding protein [Acidimicrobiales bacterium]